MSVEKILMSVNELQMSVGKLQNSMEGQLAYLMTAGMINNGIADWV